MTAILKILRGEPVLAAALLSAATTVAASFAVHQDVVGLVAGAIEVALAALARSLVTPTVP